MMMVVVVVMMGRGGDFNFQHTLVVVSGGG